MKRFFLVIVVILYGISQKCFSHTIADSLSSGDTITIIPEGAMTAEDTMNMKGKAKFLDRVSSSRLFKSTYIGVPLIVGGLIEKHQDTKFRKLRNDFFPTFHRSLDNYTQYAPAAVLVGLKAAGIPGRSSWGRMILSDAISAALMASTVQVLKSTTHVVRPDGSNNRSFPSGHTATAFMTATMLSKEYGHLSPWVGVGAYTCATATGLMRMANNKHWLSDVMVGAGIGIISTEMGYWLADAICGRRGLLREESSSARFVTTPSERPSFLGLYMGFNVPLSHYDLSPDNTFATSTGTTLGLEGAYFFNPHFGLGGRTAISNEQYLINGEEAPDNTYNYYTIHIGPYFSLPLTPRWRLDSKLLVGAVCYPDQTIAGEQLVRNHGLSLGTGFAVGYRIKQHLTGSLFADYNLQAPQSLISKEYMHTLTLGARVGINF